ncbi:MAG: CAP domain-containing protein [Actinomycetota bacterium]|nr:CAP domain-containing protein [Actinomycetota bacterium]
MNPTALTAAATTTTTATGAPLRRLAVAIALAVVATLLYVVPFADPAAATTVEPASRSEIVEGYRLLNVYRARHGVPAIRYSGSLSAKAQEWATYMARTGRFHHSELADGVPAGWRGLGENIAYNSTVRGALNAWAHSPGHRANMLNPRFDNVGIGFARVDGRLYAVQFFGDYLP